MKDQDLTASPLKKSCGTCHHACDCREAQLREVYQQLEVAADYNAEDSHRLLAAVMAFGILKRMGYGK